MQPFALRDTGYSGRIYAILYGTGGFSRSRDAYSVAGQVEQIKVYGACRE